MTEQIILRQTWKDSSRGLRCTAHITKNFNTFTDRSCGCSGGGYDMGGTSLAYVLTKYTPIIERAKNVGTDTFYGLHFYNKKTNKQHILYEDGDKVYIDGGCGKESIIRLAEALEVRVSNLGGGKSENSYLISWEEEETNGHNN